MQQQTMIAISTFDDAFAEFKASGYKVPTHPDQLLPGIEWYNANISMIRLAHSCPMPMNQKNTPNPKLYMWAYASGLIACTHMKYMIIKQ